MCFEYLKNSHINKIIQATSTNSKLSQVGLEYFENKPYFKWGKGFRMSKNTFLFTTKFLVMVLKL